jgi:hypothetical protein
VVRDGGLKPTLPDRRHLEKICVRKLPDRSRPAPAIRSPRLNVPFGSKGGIYSQIWLGCHERPIRRTIFVGHGVGPSRRRQSADHRSRQFVEYPQL